MQPNWDKIVTPDSQELSLYLKHKTRRRRCNLVERRFGRVRAALVARKSYGRVPTLYHTYVYHVRICTVER